MGVHHDQDHDDSKARQRRMLSRVSVCPLVVKAFTMVPLIRLSSGLSPGPLDLMGCAQPSLWQTVLVGGVGFTGGRWGYGRDSSANGTCHGRRAGA
jgi:hypothetical protein